MLSQQTSDLLNSLKTNRLYNHSIHHKISKIKYKKLDRILSFLMEQTRVLNLKNLWSTTYKINLQDNLIEHIIDSITEKDEWAIKIQKSQFMLFIEILNFETLYNWINLNQSNRYLCIPISFCPEYSTNDNDVQQNDSWHACTLIFDNALSEVYFFDPNGKTPYFNCFDDNHIDKLFGNYFKEFELKYQLGFSYIPISQFASSTICLNRNFSDDANANNCMIISILLPHFLHLTQHTIYQGIKELTSINNKDLFHIINSYSFGIYSLNI